jgi:DNA-directed RNA polymerase specialized sigma24 family protein
MSGTQWSSGYGGLSVHSITAWHGSRRGELLRTARDDAESAACQALARLYAEHYGSLVRLAALLTGDAGRADGVAENAFAALCSAGLLEAGDDAVSYLRRQVVIRSRQAARVCRTRGCEQPRAAEAGAGPADGPEPPASRPAACEFGRLPVVLALLALRPAEREAVVLTSYLDLPEGQAAAAAGVSDRALRRNLTAALDVLCSGILDQAGAWQP